MSTTETERLSTSDTERARLEGFLGTWSLEGRQLAGPLGPDMTITATETYEWLEGKRFLIHRFAGRMHGEEIACIEIFGHDAASHRFPTTAYYNNGDVTDWELQVRDHVWTRIGRVNVADAALEVRCTTEFGDAGKVQTATWEYRSAGSPWQTFWEVTATKAA